MYKLTYSTTFGKNNIFYGETEEACQKYIEGLKDRVKAYLKSEVINHSIQPDDRVHTLVEEDSDN